VIIIIYSVLR